MHLCHFIAALILLLANFPVIFGDTVNITDGKVLKEYLCSSKRTIAPNTHLVLYGQQLSLNTTRGEVCIVENTTNIAITCDRNYKYVTVDCISWENNGFSFFNVTNLTIKSVYFEHCGMTAIPADALKYINSSDQFFYYNGLAYTTFLFNHCNNLTLYNVLSDSSYVNDNNRFSIVGVNLCGWSNVNGSYPVNGHPLYSPTLLSVLLYYTDTAITSASQCNLLFESDTLSGYKYSDVVKNFTDNTERMPLTPIRDLAVYLSQQLFDVHVNITVKPSIDLPGGWPDCDGPCLISAIIMFVNSVTDSHVTFQGYPQEFCFNEASIPYHLLHRPVMLDIMFYKTPSFNRTLSSRLVMSPVSILDTAFMFFPRIGDRAFHFDNSVLRVIQFSEKLLYEVVLDNVAWCNNTISDIGFFGDLPWFYLFHAQSLSFIPTLYLTMNNIHVRHNYDNLLNYDSLLYFVNVNITMTGENYFGQNSGGSIIEAISSNLTITDNLTICDGYAYSGGGIKLDSASFLFLKEPLRANFFNNTAVQGGAIYAPVHENTGGVLKTVSAIQILPNKLYSSDNITNIDVRLHFDNSGGSGLESSLYAPDFCYFGRQLSAYFLFDADTWDSSNSHYVYTSLVDAIFNGTDKDKYTSLSNGVYYGFEDGVNYTYLDQQYGICSGCNGVLTVFPGQNALSLLCDNKEYQIIYEHMDDIILYQLPCETKNFTLWNTSVVNSNLSLSFSAIRYISTSYSIVLSNSALRKSIPFLTVGFNDDYDYGFICPFGFNLTGGICKCIDALKSRSYRCDIDTLQFASPPNYWTSFSHQADNYMETLSIFLSTNCPPSHCNSDVSRKFLLNDSLPDLACHNNRHGILCGQCKENYSVVFGSEECSSDCTNLYLLTLPAYALAGLLLVAVLFALRLTVASGTINGAIFYANVLELSMDVLAPQSADALQVIISLLNLNLGFPMCLYEGMTLAGKVGLQFVFPVYLWSIAIGLISLSRHSTRLSNIISNSSVQVLATLFYLSFSKLIRTVIYIISGSKVFVIKGYIESSDVTRMFSGYYYDNSSVWYYGGTGYGNGVHGFLLFLAIAFIVFFILPYAIVLSFSYYLVRFKLVNKFRPFIESYGGPFKDEWRFWFGLRLWITIILLSVNGALQGANTDQMLVAHLAIILVFILLQAHIRPFRSQLVGLVDIFFMLNYCLIIEFYLRFDSTGIFFTDVYTFLVSSAIAMFILIPILHFVHEYVYLKKPTVFANLKIKLLNKLKKYEVVVNEAEGSDEDLFEAAEERDQVADTY